MIEDNFEGELSSWQGETEDEYLTSCLLMVFVAVSIPKLARSDSSMYQAHLEVGFSSLLLSQSGSSSSASRVLPLPLFGGNSTVLVRPRMALCLTVPNCSPIDTFLG